MSNAEIAQEGVLTPTVRMALGFSALGVNVVVYGFVLWRWKRRRTLAPRRVPRGS